MTDTSATTGPPTNAAPAPRYALVIEAQADPLARRGDLERSPEDQLRDALDAS